MLVALPIGLWVFSLVSDIIYMAGWGSDIWVDVAFYTLVGGVVGAFLAAIPGFIDYLSISDEKTKKTGTKHLIFNLIVVALYVVNFLIRAKTQVTTPFTFGLSVVGTALLAYSGWLGGDMVYEHGMAVELEADGRLKKGRRRPYDEPKERSLGETGDVPPHIRPHTRS